MDAGAPVSAVAPFASSFEAQRKRLRSEFCELFEFRLEQFVEGQAFSQADFVAACQDALTNGADAWAAWNGADPARVRSKQMVDVVLSAASYESFVSMMSSAAFVAEAEEAEEDEGGAE